jgi:hypothetical protein
VIFRNLRTRFENSRTFPQLSQRRRIIYYSPNPSNILTQLFQKYGSDKGSFNLNGNPYPWPPHTYSDFYDTLWNQNRSKILKVFECGIGTASPIFPANMGSSGVPGASLYAWRDYFYNAEIYGADIDHEVLLKDDRIKTYWVDQLSVESVKFLWEEIGETNFDIILDDGLHTFKAGSTLFANTIHALAENGVYIIEDVSNSDLQLYSDFFDNKGYIVEYHLMTAEHKTYDNNLIIIRKRQIQQEMPVQFEEGRSYEN